jgi:hypothetical protein
MTDPAGAPITKAHDVAYVRFAAPDLDMIEQFVRDFGLVVAHRDENILVSRGLMPAPFVHVVHRGPAKFIGYAFTMNDEADLYALAEGVPGCSPVHDIGGVEGELGGGKRVHFIEPASGFVLEAVHGQHAEALPAERDRLRYNHAGTYEREGTLQDVGNNRKPNSADPGPPEILRLGHVVLTIPFGPHLQFLQFLQDTFGMVKSDGVEINVPPGAEDKFPPPLIAAFKEHDTSLMGQFLRMDRGERFTDHHSTLVLAIMDPRAIPPGSDAINAQLSHCAFEVFSIDDVLRGHDSLRQKKAQGKRYSLAWGVGRHVYGSQVYDYWYDPYGHVHEHWCDGDRVDISYGPNVLDFSELGPNGGNQWGPTVEESSISNLDGPQSSPFFKELPDDVQASLITRDTSDVQHVLDAI